MKEGYGHALGAEHQRLAGTFSETYPLQRQCAPSIVTKVYCGNEALTLPHGVIT